MGEVLSHGELLRQALFVPCKTREGLARWIRTYLDIDLPGGIVCDVDDRHQPSTSSPLDLIWEIYQKALDGTDPKYQVFLAYAARDSGKTLACSILELLCLFHLNRDVCHVAAVESQSQKCAKYLGKYLTRPILKDYLTSHNKRELEVTRFERDGCYPLSRLEYDQLPESEQALYRQRSHCMTITVATLQGVNGSHTSMLVLDEAELFPPDPYSEAQMIPAVGQEKGELPITLLVSSRKFPFGIIQDEINNAAERGTQIRNWNIIDQTKPCPPIRHLPTLPKIPIYVNEETLRSIGEADFQLLDLETKNKLIPDIGYAGCLTNCSLFATCRGRLATKQASTSKMLKPIDHVITVMRRAGVVKTKSQLMSWKPESTGLIYPRISRQHCLSPADMIAKITGDDPKTSATKADLIAVMKHHQMSFYAGIDHGFSHPFVIVLGGLWGKTLFVFHCIAISGLELGEKITLMEREIEHFSPTLFPDPEDPSSNKSFKSAGFSVKSFVKDVELGINTVQSKLTPAMSDSPELYFLAGDDGCEYLFDQLSTYHWKIDSAGNPTDDPDKVNDDAPDALRYLCQVLFGKDVIKHAKAEKKVTQEQPLTATRVHSDWMSKKISELTGDTSSGAPSIKKGGFRFSG